MRLARSEWLSLLRWRCGLPRTHAPLCVHPHDDLRRGISPPRWVHLPHDRGLPPEPGAPPPRQDGGCCATSSDLTRRPPRRQGLDRGPAVAVRPSLPLPLERRPKSAAARSLGGGCPGVRSGRGGVRRGPFPVRCCRRSFGAGARCLLARVHRPRRPRHHRRPAGPLRVPVRRGIRPPPRPTHVAASCDGRDGSRCGTGHQVHGAGPRGRLRPAWRHRGPRESSHGQSSCGGARERCRVDLAGSWQERARWVPSPRGPSSSSGRATASDTR